MQETGTVEDAGIAVPNVNDRIPVVCNTGDEQVFANMRNACSLPLPWLQVEEPHDGVAVLVGGGPSINAFEGEIRARKMSGQKIFAMNGSLKWLLERGIEPDFVAMLDARRASAEFVSNPCHGAKYLIASQCDPQAFEYLRGFDVTVWHPHYPGVQEVIGDRECALIGGGTTVGLQAMSIAWAMGYRTIHLYGYDSSYADSEGHAYKQKLNDGESVGEYEVSGRKFVAATWMARQAIEFQDAATQLAAGGATINVHGDGLLPWVAKAMMQPAANLACYDLSRAPAQWDFVTWLVIAEMNRRERGFPGPLKVAFKPGPKHGFRDDDLPLDAAERQRMLDKVLRPALELVGAVESDEALEGCKYSYLMYSLSESVRSGIKAPKLVPTARDLERVDRFLDGRRPVVVTLREASHWPHRNSNVDAWVAFAREFSDRETFVFVRDTEKASAPMEVATYPEASLELGLRAALYYRAKAVLGVANGPMELPMFMDVPWLMFKTHLEWGNVGTEDWWKYRVGIQKGGQYPWSSTLQRMTWSEDTFENLCREFSALRKDI